ncbi:hypothetical protein JCM3774_006668 [Rhodotorula dairenensis]
MARTKPQELKEDSEWPLWAPCELFRLALLKQGLRTGFVPGPPSARKTGKAETISVSCASAFGCSFEVAIARNKKSGVYTTERSILHHDHELLSWDDSEATRSEHARLQDEVTATVGLLKLKAQKELDALRKAADIAACSTAPVSPMILSPASEQECVLHDLADALGSQMARSFEQDMRGLKILADQYPRWSTFDGTAHPIEAPPEQRAPRRNVGSSSAMRVNPSEEKGDGTRGPGRSRKPDPRAGLAHPTDSTAEAGGSSNYSGTDGRMPEKVKKTVGFASLQKRAVKIPAAGSRNKRGEPLIDFSGSSPFAPKIPSKRRSCEKKGSTANSSRDSQPPTSGLNSPPATPSSSAHHDSDSDGDATVLATRTKRKREPAPSPVPHRPVKIETGERHQAEAPDAGLQNVGEEIAPSKGDEPAVEQGSRSDKASLSTYLRSLSSVVDFEKEYLAKLNSIGIETPEHLQYVFSQDRLAETAREVLVRRSGPIDIVLKDFEQLLEQRRSTQA